jgi:hypothetical protein
MNNRRNADQLCDGDVDLKHRKLCPETAPNNIGEKILEQLTETAICWGAAVAQR